MAVEVRPITVDEARVVRAEVLRPGSTAEQCAWPLDNDPRTLHLGGYVDGELATVASFIPEPHPQVALELHVPPTSLMKLRGMATREAFRGTGVGSAVLLQGMDELARRSVEAVWCNARVTAQRFYERHGYSTWGRVFENPPAGPHIVMWRRLL